TFPANEVELARTRALSALALQLSQPGAVAQRFFESEIYGRDPYGRSATRESYRAVTRDDVTQFARQRLQPVGALLVVAGDVTDAQARALVAKACAGWRLAPASAPAGSAAGRHRRQSARTWRRVPCASCSIKSIGSGPRGYRTRSSWPPRDSSSARSHSPSRRRARSRARWRA